MKREVPIKVTVVLIPLAIACMAFGIYRGEVATVLAKAINICTALRTCKKSIETRP